MTPPAPSRRPGEPWNAGAWFGTQAGCTAWVLLQGIVLLPRDVVAGGAALGVCGALTALGILSWTCRRRLSFFAAVTLLLVALTIATAFLVLLCDRRGIPDLPPWILVIPAAALVWFFLFGKGRAANAPSST